MIKIQTSLLKNLTLTVCIFSAFTGLAFSNPCEKEIISAARNHGVPIGILYSVGLTETGRKGSLQPFALNVAGKAHFPPTKEKARMVFDQALSNGIRLIDLGCMQINYHYHAQQFSGVDEMLDPTKNVEYAAKFLMQLRRRHQSWTMAVARYHAGPNNNPAQKKYVCRVISNLVATGFGKWTPTAKTFCQK